MMPPYSMIAVALAAVLGIGFGGWQLYEHGKATGRADAVQQCATDTASANAKAIDDWKAATEAQRKADAAARADDAERSRKAADQAQAVADRFEKMRIAVVKMPPAGSCVLSDEFLRRFNDAK